MAIGWILAELEAMGNEARRAHYVRAGVTEGCYGVKLGDLRVLAKRVGVNHDLGLELWGVRNVEAQLVATLLLKAKLLTRGEVDRMTRGVICAQVADWWNSAVVSKHGEKEVLRQAWMGDGDRWAARSGWSLTCERVNQGAEGLDLGGLLDRIEAEMAGADPVVQWTMNFTLGSIGIRHAAYRERAVAIGEKIGLYRDWPVAKGCTPPYVPVWVEAMVKRG